MPINYQIHTIGIFSLAVFLQTSCSNANMSGKSSLQRPAVATNQQLPGLPTSLPSAPGATPEPSTDGSPTETKSCDAVTAKVSGTVTVNSGFCATIPTDNYAFGIKDLLLAGTAAGKCDKGVFSPDSIQTSGSGGKMSGALCGWSYSVGGVVNVASEVNGSRAVTTTLSNTTKPDMAISITNRKLSWTSTLVKVTGTAKSALASGDPQGHTPEPYVAEITIPTTCSCP